MCGRFNLITNPDEIAAHFDVDNVSGINPRYNIAPTQDILAIVSIKRSERMAVFFHWGLIPSWSKDVKVGNRMINARAETVAEKPAFRAAFKKRRCLIPATGFYEWQQLNGHKQPYHIHLTNNDVFCFAGLWEHWESDGKAIRSCTILTMKANELMTPIHDRMPVILQPDAYALWLDHQVTDVSVLQPLFHPTITENRVAERISTRINNPANDNPLCIKSVT